MQDVYELRSFADVVGDRDLASLVGFEARKFVSTIAQGMIEWLQVRGCVLACMYVGVNVLLLALLYGPITIP